MSYEPLPECGSCSGCKLKATVLEVVAMIDARHEPRIRAAAEDLQRALEYDDGRDPRIKALHRSYRRARDNWMTERSRVFDSKVCMYMACDRVGVVIMRG